MSTNSLLHKQIMIFIYNGILSSNKIEYIMMHTIMIMKRVKHKGVCTIWLQFFGNEEIKIKL